MTAMDASISSTSPGLLPATCLWGLYAHKYEDTSIEALHWTTTLQSAFFTLYFSLDCCSSQVLLIRHRLYSSLSTPASRLWGKSFTSSRTLISRICSWGVHVSLCRTEGARTFLRVTSYPELRHVLEAVLFSTVSDVNHCIIRHSTVLNKTT